MPVFWMPQGPTAPGTLNWSFSGDGKNTIAMGTVEDYGHSVAIQPDGKIIIAGNVGPNSSFTTDFGVARFNADGSIDTTFGTGGKVVIDFSNQDNVKGVGVQSDGKIVVAGQANWASGSWNGWFVTARFNSNGTLDTTYGSSGKFIHAFNTSNDGVSHAVMAPDDKMLLVGSNRAAGCLDNGTLMRITTSGTLDTTFSGDGIEHFCVGGGGGGPHAVDIHTDGSIFLAAREWQGGSDNDAIVMKYTSSGSPDTTFGSSGRVFYSVNTDSWHPYDILVQSDGKVLMSGINYTTSQYWILRYTSAGVLDTTFDGDGILLGTSFPATRMLQQSDGKILLVAGNGNFWLQRRNTDWSLDSTFGTGGNATADFYGSNDVGTCMLLDSSNTLIVGGHAYVDATAGYDFAVAKFNR